MNFCNKELFEKIEVFIQSNKEQIIEDLASLVRIPSVLSESNATAPFGEDCKKIIDAVKELYQKHGYYSKTENQNKYVLSYYGNKSDKQIGIFSHADVVPADGEWLYCKPFDPIVKDGYMFGRGCNDDKSGIIQALYAAEIIKKLELPLKSELVMFAGANEESGMQDIATFCKKERMPDASLVPDGEYPFYSGEKTMLEFDIVSKNKLEVIKKFKGGTASNIVLGELFAELDYSKELWQEIIDLCQNNNAFEIKQSDESIFIKTKGKSNHVANIENSLNAAQIMAEMLLKCESLSSNDKNLLNDIFKFISSGYGNGFGIEHKDDFGNLVCGNGIADITEEGKLKLSFAVRCSPFLNTDESIEKIKNATTENWGIDILKNSKGYLIAENEPIANIIKNVYSYLSESKESKPLKTSGGTYSRMLNNAYSIGNIAPYKTKAIDLPDGHGGFHQPDEKLSIDGFLEGIKILVCMIMEIDSFLYNTI